MFGPLGTCVACSDLQPSFCVFPAQKQQQCHSERDLKSKELALLLETQSAWVAFLAVLVAQQRWKREVRAWLDSGVAQIELDAIREPSGMGLVACRRQAAFSTQASCAGSGGPMTGSGGPMRSEGSLRDARPEAFPAALRASSPATPPFIPLPETLRCSPSPSTSLPPNSARALRPPRFTRRRGAGP